jgi:hypothetical protein
MSYAIIVKQNNDWIPLYIFNTYEKAKNKYLRIERNYEKSEIGVKKWS